MLNLSQNMFLVFVPAVREQKRQFDAVTELPFRLLEHVLACIVAVPWWFQATL